MLADVDNATDLDALRDWAFPLLQTDPQVLATSVPQVVITALKPGGYTVAFRAFTLAGHSAPTQGRLIEQVQRALVQQGVNGPVSVTYSYVRAMPA